MKGRRSIAVPAIVLLLALSTAGCSSTYDMEGLWFKAGKDPNDAESRMEFSADGTVTYRGNCFLYSQSEGEIIITRTADDIDTYQIGEYDENTALVNEEGEPVFFREYKDAKDFYYSGIEDTDKVNKN